ncbi:V-type ATP synthase subunit E [Anaerostipes sp.]|uniref:V-type ATP synthase subunit E n=1 Tax=Anaerostipes sp. TaxID=1872530 RepID=UPI0025B8BF42|nr:V-type ATP synthase subunit E [Anaerostipes sp.]MBS7007346.1 V-type ATP synthase subunit E [Anaerostipes sp.]
MTLEEKIQNLQRVSMKEARAEGNALIQGYSNQLSQRFEEHKEKERMQAELRVETEKSRTKLRLNKELSEFQLELRREQNECQEKLKQKLFDRVRTLLSDYMKTNEYTDMLCRKVTEAMQYAGGEETVIYLNPSDEPLKAQVEERTGASLFISREDFIGGIRAVIRTRNVLIDRSFSSALEKEYADFLFLGGEENV